MATEKKFAVAGVSTLNGKTKIRFANDTMRIKILGKNGHTGVDLIELPSEMTKGEIAQHLIATAYGKGNAAIEAAIAYVAKKNPAVKAVNSATVAKTEAVAA
jgi:hypothetical protein